MSNPRPKPKASRKVIAGLVAFIALVFMGSVACDQASSRSNSSRSSSVSAAAPSTSPPGHMNQEVRNGKLAFTVTGVDTDSTSTIDGTVTLVSVGDLEGWAG